jgi:hypothetical protein
MDAIKEALAPLIDRLPPGVRDFLDAGGWWLVLALAALLILLLVAGVLRALKRALFGRRHTGATDFDRDLRIELIECPLPVRPPLPQRLTVYHLPVRLRLIVVAPSGTELSVDPMSVEKLLDFVVPGLSAQCQLDRPRIRVWPAQFSHQGFAAAFHRCTRKAEAEGLPSRWVLVAGKFHVGTRTVHIGFGFWADEANAVGRLTLEPHQWLDVLRIKTAEG